jgi:hypothetical protein
MPGHVFHPGHEELHGVTVVVEGASGRTWVGRYHEQTPQGVLLHDAASHDAAPAEPDRAAWIARQLKFGIRAEHKVVVVPLPEVTRITRLVEWESGPPTATDRQPLPPSGTGK